MRSVRAILALAVATLAWGCDHELESTCISGDCADYVAPQPVITTYSLPANCLDGCDTTTVSGQTGEFPCEVEAIMQNCRRCHVSVNPEIQAPFLLETYADSQQLYNTITIWSNMTTAVPTDFMPLTAPKLTPIEKVTLLDQWACICAPPRDAGEVCE